MARSAAWADGLWQTWRRRVSPLVAGVIVCALLAIALGIAVRAGTPDTRGVARLVGRAAPDFTLRAERDGTRLPGLVRLGDLRGKSALVVFVYSLCPHCGATAQAVRDAAAAEGGTFQAFYVDSPAETPSIAGSYAARLGLDAPLLLDSGGAVAARYGITAYPVTLLLDGNGIIRHVLVGEVSTTTLLTDLRGLD
jgi:peroxiredoxin